MANAYKKASIYPPPLPIRSLIWLHVLYNFDQFITPLWLWHAWRNFHFVTLTGGLWHRQIFVGPSLLSSHFGWVVGWICSGGTLPGQKLVVYHQKGKIFSQNHHIRMVVTNDPFISSGSLVTCDKAHISTRQVALWPMTDELIEILQYPQIAQPHARASCQLTYSNIHQLKMFWNSGAHAHPAQAPAFIQSNLVMGAGDTDITDDAPASDNTYECLSAPLLHLSDWGVGGLECM
jgi:hypothetical protein